MAQCTLHSKSSLNSRGKWLSVQPTSSIICLLMLFKVWPPMRNGDKPSISHFKIFGSSARTHIPSGKQNKSKPINHFYIPVGYNELSKAYHLYDHSRNMIECRDVIFDEVTTYGLSRSFPLPLKGDSLTEDPSMFQWIFLLHVMMLIFILTRQVFPQALFLQWLGKQIEDLIFDSSNSNPTKVSSPILKAPFNTPLLVVEHLNDDEEFLIDPSDPTPLPPTSSRPMPKWTISTLVDVVNFLAPKGKLEHRLKITPPFHHGPFLLRPVICPLN